MSRRKEGDIGPHGLVVVDKPSGPTSHDVVDRCRKIFGLSRVGHAGTLDPLATGVLCVGLGRATRLLRFVGSGRKRYTATISLGTATDTMDAAGSVTGSWDMSNVTLEQLREASAQLTGPIMQVPPMVSALKVAGKRLHELARQGLEVERAPRPVTVESFDLVAGATQSEWVADIRCSAGTYVRVLADDLGAMLGGGAHLSALRRTEVEPFTIDQALKLDSLSEMANEAILSPLETVGHLERIHVDEELAAKIVHGSVIKTEVLAVSGEGPWAIVGPGGDLLAVYEIAPDEMIKPAVVIATVPAGGG